MVYPAYHPQPYYNSYAAHQYHTGQQIRYSGSNRYPSQSFSDPFSGDQPRLNQGNNFLDPDYIGSEVNDFVSNFDSKPLIFKEHADAENILEATDDQLSRIFNTSYIPNNKTLPSNQPNYYAGTNPNGLFSDRPNASGILIDTTSYANAIVGRYSVFNQPTVWQANPWGGGSVPYHPENPVYYTQPYVLAPPGTYFA